MSQTSRQTHEVTNPQTKKYEETDPEAPEWSFGGTQREPKEPKETPRDFRMTPKETHGGQNVVLFRKNQFVGRPFPEKQHPSAAISLFSFPKKSRGPSRERPGAPGPWGPCPLRNCRLQGSRFPPLVPGGPVADVVLVCRHLWHMRWLDHAENCIHMKLSIEPMYTILYNAESR